MGFVGFIQVRWVHWGALWRSSGLSGVAWFTGERPEGPLVHPGSLGSLGCVLGVFGFVGCRRVHWGAHWGSSGSSGVAGFIGLRPCACRVNAGSLG